ncbi:MAG: hypothetical protein M3416_01770 [Acidobacteriota bacterium]|nr:hypothetical protein [Acidobacteriota bacterium]
MNLLSPDAGKTPNTPSGGTAGEGEALRQRVEELEKQNRVMAQTLSEVRAKLETMNPSEAASYEVSITG